MRSRGYTGKRVYGGANRSRGDSQALQTLGRVLFFPVLIFYLELVLHIAMGYQLKYLPIYLFFSVSAGLILSALTLPFSRLANQVIIKVLSGLLTLLYVVELMAKKILQTFYPLSILETAAGNHLTDYTGVIVENVLANLPVIILSFLPFILLLIFGGRVLGWGRFDVRFSGLVVAGAVIFHLLGLGAVHLPWGGDLTPAQLYRVDTNIDDQVEQLGMWTMLRLDAKHMIVPPKGNLDSDFSGLDNLGGGSSSGGDTSAENPEPVVDTSPNVMDVDLAALAESTSNEDVAWLANYFNSVTPTRKNEYTGMFEGYNVIQLVLEGFSGYAIDPELTPTLYRLSQEGFRFENFYTPSWGVSTSDGEYVTTTGLIPKGGVWSYLRSGENYMPFGFGHLFSAQGYRTLAYHDHTYTYYGRDVSYPNMGYEYYGVGNGLDVRETWPESDVEMMEVSVPQYIDEDRFMVYYLTVSGHLQYNFMGNYIAYKNRELVADLPYSEAARAYMACQIELDRAVENLIDQLRAAGKLEDTVIVLSGDHYPYGLTNEQFSELLGHEVDPAFELYKSTLLLWNAEMEEPVTVEKYCSSLDVMPTLANLFALPYDSRLVMGRDILSDAPGLVIFSDYSFLTDQGAYVASKDQYTPWGGGEPDYDYVRRVLSDVTNRFTYSRLILEKDYYQAVLGKEN